MFDIISLGCGVGDWDLIGGTDDEPLHCGHSSKDLVLL